MALDTLLEGFQLNYESFHLNIKTFVKGYLVVKIRGQEHIKLHEK